MHGNMKVKFKLLFHCSRNRQYDNAFTRDASCTVIMKVMTKCGLKNTASFIFVTKWLGSR